MSFCSVALYLELTSSGKVIDVHDGDTITVREADTAICPGTFRIRLNGIDAPESNQPHGEDATSFLTSKLIGTTVDVRFTQLEVYGRILGDVYLNGVNVNLEMLICGLAWKSNYSKDSYLQKLEDEARKAKVGIWKYDDNEEPWLYRKRMKEASKR